MVYSAINCPDERRVFNQEFEKLLNDNFKYTKEVNVHVLYNFISPTNQLGEYDFILFIDVPYKKGNYYRILNKIYLNTLAIAVRRFEEPEIINADEECFYTEDGSWEYRAEIESERQSLRRYVYDNIPNVKHFDVAVIYLVNAPNSNKAFHNDCLYFNEDINIAKAIFEAINLTQNKEGKAANCIVYKDKESSNDWSEFITNFVEYAERHTKQGILTKKKVDSITVKKTSRLMEQANRALGNKLCIIRGKAGTGKTLALLRLMYEQVKTGEDAPKHNCRLLTFNNMLVMDLKMIMKNIGSFTPTKASISSIHKFFYDIYKVSPVRYLHMDNKKINDLFNLCTVRTMRINLLIQTLSKEKNTTNVKILIDELQIELTKKDSRVKKEDWAECKEYQKYLLERKDDLALSELFTYMIDYVNYKRNVFLNNYHRQEFLNGYNVILQELYLVFHNLDDFIEKYKMKIAYSQEETRNTDEFKEKYQVIYNQFLNDAMQHLLSEYELDMLVPDLLQKLENVDQEAATVFAGKSKEEQKESFTDSLKRIRRKVNWSKLILIDEAQDCQVYEKALLLELNGSDNTVIATGGRDQLIRTPKENDWSQLFGKQLDTEKITLRNVSYRQKENIVLFLNSFAETFNIETRLSVPDETKGAGRVIIDCRSFDSYQIPLDMILSLHLNGKDMGCSNFENMMFLLPQEGYVKRIGTDELDVTIDNNSTILINQASAQRSLTFKLPESFNLIDGTINDKRKALRNVGQDNTRCLLYESCRGLEAWNVMCIDLNDFYYEKMKSKDAEEYAENNAGGLFEEGKNLYKSLYASLWCYMAMTRAIDTLYIKLSNSNNLFSQTILSLARLLPQIEIIEGEYIEQRASDEEASDVLPF